MTLTQIVVLALIQGLTEFLPVSSSAHLIFPSQMWNWPDQGLAFDVAVHIGTLLAVIIYYLSDLVKIGTYMVESVVRMHMTPLARVGWMLVAATIPAGIAGLVFEQQIATIGRSIEVIAYTTIGYGILLGVASVVNRKLCWRTLLKIEGERADSLRHVTWPQAMVIGCAQALSIVPGTSRSGITLTAGLLLGLRPEAAARFSFLLAIPVIMASGLLEGYHIIETEGVVVDYTQMLLGVTISFFVAVCVIHLFMKFISRSGMGIFVFYRIVLGLVLLFFFV
ncbi:MAG: undecaprenyl-diphosphate phosphatase [Succinivibrionaceae bacterium]|nr:undecaprenyl-diphosphate phosphatase [Succinivibrionaceae bacterium]